MILDNGNHSAAAIQASCPVVNPALESQLRVGGCAHVHEPLHVIQPTFQTFGANFSCAALHTLPRSITS